MRKITLITLTFLLAFSCFTSAQIEAEYYRSDDSNNVQYNKPITIIYPAEIIDTNGFDLNSVNLKNYIRFTTEDNEVAFSAFNNKPNQITIIPHNDMAGGQYNISLSPLKYKESDELTESFQCEFKVNIYAQQQTVETAYLNSFNYLIENYARGEFPTDTFKRIEEYLLPENLSYLNLEQNQAERMRAVAPIFEGMERNPELAKEMLIQSVNSLGTIEDILPLSDEAEAERMYALASLFISTARQPEIADTLNLLADTLLGIPDDFAALSDKAKAARMNSLGVIFESIARQPEAYRTLLNQGLRYHGAIDFLGNTTSETEAARMMALSNLFEATARQPEAHDSLNIATDTLLGIPDDFSQFDDQVLAARMRAFSSLFESTARQPEMADSMLQQAIRYMGRFKDLSELDSLSERERMISLGLLWGSMARQPEASEKMCSMVDTLMGIPEDFSALSNLGKEGRIIGLDPLFEAMARQPEISFSLLAKSIRFCGTNGQIGELSERAQAYRMHVFGSVFESIARQPEIWKKIDLAAETLLGIPDNFESLTDFMHEGRVHGIERLFESIGRQPEYCDILLTLGKKYLGTFEQTKPIPAKYRFMSVSSLITSMSRQFEYADTLDLAAESLIGVPKDLNNLDDEDILMRFKAIEGLLRYYPETNEEVDYLLNIMYKYLGKWSQINKESKFSEMARLQAAQSLFIKIYESPEKTSEYIAVFDTLLGTTNDFTKLDIEVRYHRQIALYEFYNVYFQSIGTTTTDSLLKAAHKVLGTNTECPIQSWTEAEIRMDVLNHSFEGQYRGFYSKGFIEEEKQFVEFNYKESTIKEQKPKQEALDNESLEELVSIIEEFSGNPNPQFSNNNKVNYSRQMADGHLTNWLKSNEIHDTIIADVRERLLSCYTPEKPILFGAPSDNSIDVPVDYKMHLLFTDIMYAYDSTLISKATIQDSIKLTTIENEPVEFSIEINSNNRTISIIPTEELTHGMQYKLIVPECFINFDDSTANAITNVFKVEKALLKVIAENKEINEGDDIPELTMIFEGFVDNDTEEDITKPEITTEATSTSAADVYPIILSGGSSDKYDFELTNGSLNILETTGIDFSVENTKVKLYPNPATDVLYFETGKDDLQITDIEIINQQGQVVLIKQISASNNISTINISALKVGLYIIYIHLDDQTKVSYKIMKQ
ncbi:MAG: T9SS type A sorting domain-containing protein [Bacteroidales bacterium]|nr:T9SS type A sorting domain-containing protein [Bacteroidales bacterium]